MRFLLLALILVAPLAAAPCEVRAGAPKCADCGDGCQCGQTCGCDAARLERILGLPAVMECRDGSTARGSVGALSLLGGVLDAGFVRDHRLTPADVEAVRQWVSRQRAGAVAGARPAAPSPPVARYYLPAAPPYCDGPT